MFEKENGRKLNIDRQVCLSCEYVRWFVFEWNGFVWLKEWLKMRE